MFVYCLTLNATQKLRSYEYIWPLLAASNYFLNYITVGCRSTALLYEDCLKSFMTKKQLQRFFFFLERPILLVIRDRKDRKVLSFFLIRSN